MLCIYSSHSQDFRVYANQFTKVPEGYLVEGSIYSYGAGFLFEEVSEVEYLSSLKQSKFDQVLDSAERALKSFQFQGLTMELSGDSKTNLMVAQSQILSGAVTQYKWRALNGTYKLGDTGSFMLTTENLSAFARAMEEHYEDVLFWQDLTEAYLLNASTIEEVEAISTEYGG